MRIMVRWTLMGVMLAGLLLSACGGGGAAQPTTAAPAATSAGDASAGQAKFASSCTACHGADATGVAGLGKDLTTSAFVKGLSDAEVVAFIKIGRPSGDPANTTGVDMPPKGGNPALSDQDLADIVAYMRSIEK